MKLYINGRYLTQDITGVQRYAHELIKCIDAQCAKDRQLEVTLLAPRQRLKYEVTFRNIILRRVGGHSGHAWEQWDLPQHSMDGLLFCPGNTAPVLSLLLNRPVVVTVHDLSYKYFPSAYKWRFKLVYNVLMPLVFSRCRRLITVSRSEFDAIAAHYPAVKAKMDVVQNGGLGAEFLSGLGAIKPHAPGFSYGLYVGSTSKRKNFPALVAAAVQLSRQTNNGFVFIGGAGSALTVCAEEVPADVRNRIIFLGQLDNTVELIRWYKGATFMAFPSLYEASPLPPIEAMICGCPVLASAIPSMTERCGDAAIYCDPQNPLDILEKMVLLSSDSQLRADLIRRGIMRAAQFSWDTCAAKTLEILRSTREMVAGELEKYERN